MSRYWQKIALYTLAYLATGYAVVLGLYLVSSPGYIHNRHVGELVMSLAVRGDFWRDVVIWPLTLVFYFTGRT